MENNTNFSPRFIEPALNLPNPFDPHLASVTIRSDANTADDGYDVLLSVDVSPQVITLRVGEDELDLTCDIFEGEIAFEFLNTNVDFGTGYFEQLSRLEEREELAHQIAHEKSDEFGFEISANPKLNYKRGRSSRTNGTTKQTGNVGRFRHPQLPNVGFGNWKKQSPLDGRIIADYRGWRLTTNEKDSISGVVALLRTRKNWLNFTDPRASEKGRFGRVINSLASSNEAREREKTQRFLALVKELVFLGLQKPGETKYATLAAAGLVVTSGGQVHQILPSNETTTIKLSETKLLRFLAASPSEEGRISRDIISSEAASLKNKRQDFVPTAPYFRVLDAYLDLWAAPEAENRHFEPEELKAKYTDKVLQPLITLGFLEKRQGRYRLIRQLPDVSLVQAFRTVVGRQETIRFVVDYVNENPTGTTKAIGEAVNMAFSKAWKKTSFQRFGHQLKSWSTFEGPKRGVGGWGIISDEHQLLIEKLIAQKICASNQIYEKLGVSQITLNRWRQSDDNTKFTKSGKWAMRNSSD